MASEADFGMKNGQTPHQEAVATILSSVLQFMRRAECCDACMAKVEGVREVVTAPTSVD